MVRACRASEGHLAHPSLLLRPKRTRSRHAPGSQRSVSWHGTVWDLPVPLLLSKTQSRLPLLTVELATQINIARSRSGCFKDIKGWRQMNHPGVLCECNSLPRARSHIVIPLTAGRTFQFGWRRGLSCGRQVCSRFTRTPAEVGFLLFRPRSVC